MRARTWEQQVARVMRGDSFYDSQGYVKLYLPMHPRASQQYIREHVVVAERLIGRSLQNGEHVHHINHVRDDNRPENIEVLPEAEHRHRHRLTHCKRGHAMSGANLYVRRDTGKRMCWTCMTLRTRARYYHESLESIDRLSPLDLPGPRREADRSES